MWEPFDIATLVSMSAIYVFVFAKLKFKLDFSGILTLIFHWLVSGQRLANHYINGNDSIDTSDRVTQIIGNCFIWISLYYFTFELYLIKSTLEAESQAEIDLVKRKINIYKRITYSMNIVNSIILAWMAYQYISNSFVLSLTSTAIIDCTNAGIKFIIDLTMYWQFINLLRYFVNIRYKRSVLLGLEFTLFNKFLVCWTVFLWMLCVYHSVN